MPINSLKIKYSLLLTRKIRNKIIYETNMENTKNINSIQFISNFYFKHSLDRSFGSCFLVYLIKANWIIFWGGKNCGDRVENKIIYCWLEEGRRKVGFIFTILFLLP